MSRGATMYADKIIAVNAYFFLMQIPKFNVFFILTKHLSHTITIIFAV
jgi:hypothetical protein